MLPRESLESAIHLAQGVLHPVPLALPLALLLPLLPRLLLLLHFPRHRDLLDLLDLLDRLAWPFRTRTRTRTPFLSTSANTTDKILKRASTSTTSTLLHATILMTVPPATAVITPMGATILARIKTVLTITIMRMNALTTSMASLVIIFALMSQRTKNTTITKEG